MVRLYFNPQAFEFVDPYESKQQVLDQSQLLYVADLDVDTLAAAWQLAQNGVSAKYPNWPGKPGVTLKADSAQFPHGICSVAAGDVFELQLGDAPAERYIIELMGYCKL